MVRFIFGAGAMLFNPFYDALKLLIESCSKGGYFESLAS
jgi:hypothetical protein